MTENILHTPALYRYLVIAITEKVSERVPPREAAEMARDIATSFCRNHEGEIVRVPNLSRVEKAARDKLIKEQAETMSVAEIAELHELNEKTVRRALSA